MNPVDIVIIAIVALGVGAAVFFAVRRKKRGACCGCGGDCETCKTVLARSEKKG